MPPAREIDATAAVAAAAVAEIAPKEIKNKITAIIKYVQDSIMCYFPSINNRTTVPNNCSIIIIKHYLSNCKG